MQRPFIYNSHDSFKVHNFQSKLLACKEHQKSSRLIHNTVRIRSDELAIKLLLLTTKNEKKKKQPITITRYIHSHCTLPQIINIINGIISGKQISPFARWLHKCWRTHFKILQVITSESAFDLIPQCLWGFSVFCCLTEAVDACPLFLCLYKCKVIWFKAVAEEIWRSRIRCSGEESTSYRRNGAKRRELLWKRR